MRSFDTLAVGSRLRMTIRKAIPAGSLLCHFELAEKSPITRLEITASERSLLFAEIQSEEADDDLRHFFRAFSFVLIQPAFDEFVRTEQNESIDVFVFVF